MTRHIFKYIIKIQCYCYNPTDKQKREMQNMTVWARDPSMRPQDNRPELSPHYQQTKDCFNAGINFCEICGDGACSCNKYIVHMYATTCEMISKLSHIEDGPINLSMHHFFNYREMIFFLETFTQE